MTVFVCGQSSQVACSTDRDTATETRYFRSTTPTSAYELGEGIGELAAVTTDGDRCISIAVPPDSSSGTPENGLALYVGVVDGEVVEFVFDDLPIQ